MANKKTIDFTKCEIEKIDGTKVSVDYSKFAKDIAEIVYNGTTKLGVKLACQEIYKTGKCEYCEDVVGELTSVIEALTLNEQPIGIVLKEGLLSALKQ